MGVDAMIFGVCEHKRLTPDEVLALAADLAEAVGSQHFDIDPDETRYGGSRHALRLSADSAHYGVLCPDGGCVVEVNTGHRYYGEGYERGPFPAIAATCEWLRLRGFRVYYGGDSGGCELWDAQRAALWAHWAKVGGRPYREGFNRVSLARGGDALDAERRCVLCDHPMYRSGWGPTFAVYNCDSCDRRDETKDGGATWTCKRNDREFDPATDRRPNVKPRRYP